MWYLGYEVQIIIIIIIKPKLAKDHKVYELVRRSTQALATRNSTCSEALHSMI